MVADKAIITKNLQKQEPKTITPTATTAQTQTTTITNATRPPLNQRLIQTGQTTAHLHNKITTHQKHTTITNVLHKDTQLLQIQIADQTIPLLRHTPVLLIAEVQIPLLQEVPLEATTPPLHVPMGTALLAVAIPPLHVPAEAVHPEAVAAEAAVAVAQAEAAQAVVAVVIANNSY